MAFVRLLKDLMRDKEIGKRFVLIAPDEYRTFGMDAFFPSAKIYNPLGQQYESVDRELLLAYKESPTGQMLHDGISEAGCTASLIAAGSAYATHGEPLIPVYVFYSMFGFQRTGDQFWQMADQLARGFVLGATAGRTTLTGEGLQHADGHSQLLASTNPALRRVRPGVRLRDRAHRPGRSAPDVRRPTSTRTARTSSTTSPSTTSRSSTRPSRRTWTSRASSRASTASARASRARSRRRSWPPAWRCRGRSRRSGSSPRSGTSGRTSGRRPPGTSCGARPSRWSEHNLLHPEEEQRVPYVTRKLSGAEGPFVAVSDWMRSVPDQIARWVPGHVPVAGRGRLRLRRHARRGPALLPHRRAVDRAARC